MPPSLPVPVKVGHVPLRVVHPKGVCQPVAASLKLADAVTLQRRHLLALFHHVVSHPPEDTEALLACLTVQLKGYDVCSALPPSFLNPVDPSASASVLFSLESGVPQQSV